MLRDKIKKILIIAMGLSITFTGCSSSNTSSNSDEVIETGSENEMSNEFYDAVTAIGMDSSNIKNIKDMDDWASGHRYSFMYDGYRYVVYELDNGEIDSINNDNLTVKIYERGFEPLNYKDFEPDSSILDSLMESGLNELSKYIQNETSIKNQLGTTTFYRIYDYYSFNGEVEAKNNVDKEKYTFTVDFIVEDSSATCKYVSIDGIGVFGNQDEIPEINKTPSDENGGNETSEDVIVISDGKEGAYGKFDKFDGEDYLRYYVPVGTYNVKCVIRGGFYIETIELHKEDGWDTATTISQVMMDSGETTTITINEGQCISLIINTEIELTKQ